MSRHESLLKWGLSLAALCGLLLYLRDPPWLGNVTSGFHHWELDSVGVRFRWMGGRASFFVPAGASRVEIPFHALFPAGPSDPFLIDVRIDDKRVTQIILGEGGWITATVPIRTTPTSRKFRRVDLYANRTWSEQSLSVQVGDVKVQ